MAKFSLLQVTKHRTEAPFKGCVDGYLTQHCVGVTLEQAKEKSRATERANSNRIEIAVVDEISTCRMGEIFICRKPL